MSRIFSQLSLNAAKFHFLSPWNSFIPLKSCWVSCTGCILQAGPVTCTDLQNSLSTVHSVCWIRKRWASLWSSRDTHPFLLCPTSSRTKVFSYGRSTASFFSLRRKALLLLFPQEELRRKRISLRQKSFLKCFCRLRSLASSYKYGGREALTFL